MTNDSVIVHVEDDAALRKIIKRALGKDHNVVSAASFAALDDLLASGQRVDAFLIDLNLPDSGAARTLKAIRRLSRFAPVIVMSAFLTPEMVEDLTRSGAYAAFEKADTYPLTAVRTTIAAASRNRRRFKSLAAISKLVNTAENRLSAVRKEAKSL